jgi:hypothetical protein
MPLWRSDDVTKEIKLFATQPPSPWIAFLVLKKNEIGRNFKNKIF